MHGQVLWVLAVYSGATHQQAYTFGKVGIEQYVHLLGSIKWRNAETCLEACNCQ